MSLQHPTLAGDVCFDVAIVGGGPAGLTTAFALSRIGASVFLADRTRDPAILGEGLPPAAAASLRELGLWKRFAADGHLPSYGNRSLWGSPIAVEHDFARHPEGAGWRLDRPRFVAMLATAAAEAGAVHLAGARVRWCEPAALGRGWRLGIASDGGIREVRIGFVVDASGRSRWLARSLGADVEIYDHLVGVVGTLAPGGTGEDRDSATLVEAVRDGWWYAARLPDRRLVAGYLTDAGTVRGGSARATRDWLGLMEAAGAVRRRVEAREYRSEGPPRTVCADSSRLGVVWGEGWCAVGDAAAAHDPLSSGGILAALDGGMRAARAIAAGGGDALAAYGEWVRHEYARYLAQLLGYYALERRWPEFPFWRVRHLALEQVMSS